MRFLNLQPGLFPLCLFPFLRPCRLDGLPVNSAMSMGVHESQSLLWERMVALSKPFAKYLLPKLKVCGCIHPCVGM